MSATGRLLVPRGAGVLAGLALCAIAAGACTDSAAGGSPTGPGPTAPPPTAPPPSGVANISGGWTGRSGFEQANNAIFFSDLSGSVAQSDRAVQGSFRFTSGGWEGWTATFSGTLAGTAPDTQFLGSIEYRAPASTGTGSCVGQAIFAGRSASNALLWEAADLTMTNSEPTQPSHSCRGLMRKLALVMSR